MKKYSTLIFDLDDTLIDNYKSVSFALECTARKLGIPYTNELLTKWLDFEKKYWNIFEKNQMKILETIKTLEDKISYVRSRRFVLFFKDLNLTMEEATQINDFYCAMQGINIFEIEHASSTVKELSNNHEILIATNGPRNAAIDKLKKIAIRDCISHIISAEDVGFSKPNIEFFEYLYKTTNNGNKEKMLLIGDSLSTDILGGMNNGIDTCWFNPYKKPLPETYKPTHTINCLSQLKTKL